MSTFGAGEAPRSEDEILRCLDRHFPREHPSLVLGRGDDCALLRSGRPLCLSNDLFLEDTHFRRSYFTAREAGAKALAVNISDIAACGGRPLGFALALGLPDWVDMPWLDEFFAGMSAMANSQRMVLAGGDLSRSDRLLVSITVWGETAETDAFLGRDGCCPGDTLFLVGQIGLARIGLEELEANGRSALEQWPAACAAHLAPSPLVDAGLMLARAGYNARPPALMDVSDGLMRDLPRLLGWGRQAGGRTLGADMVLPAATLHAEVQAHARNRGRNPVAEALLGGEDYALLGACAPDMLGALHSAIPGLKSIGTVTSAQMIVCNNVPLYGEGGFDHFSR